MTASRIRSALRRRRAAVTTAGVAAVLVAGVAAVLVAAGTTTAVAAGSTPSASSTPSAVAACAAPGVGRLLQALPNSLKTDLATLRKDPKSAKAADRAEIKKKALAGAYGGQVGRVAHIVDGHPGALASAIPAPLRADLKTLRGDAKGSAARTAEVATIWSKAVAGSYGAALQTAAEQVRATRAAHCSAASPAK